MNQLLKCLDVPEYIADEDSIGTLRLHEVRGCQGNTASAGYMLQDGTLLSLSEKDQKWLALNTLFD